MLIMSSVCLCRVCNSTETNDQPSTGYQTLKTLNLLYLWAITINDQWPVDQMTRYKTLGHHRQKLKIKTLQHWLWLRVAVCRTKCIIANPDRAVSLADIFAKACIYHLSWNIVFFFHFLLAWSKMRLSVYGSLWHWEDSWSSFSS